MGTDNEMDHGVVDNWDDANDGMILSPLLNPPKPIASPPPFPSSSAMLEICWSEDDVFSAPIS